MPGEFYGLESLLTKEASKQTSWEYFIFHVFQNVWYSKFNLSKLPIFRILFGYFTFVNCVHGPRLLESLESNFLLLLNFWSNSFLIASSSYSGWLSLPADGGELWLIFSYFCHRLRRCWPLLNPWRDLFS